MRNTMLLLFFAALVLVIAGGCERKVVNEVVSEAPPGGVFACFNCHTDTDETGQEIRAARQGYVLSKHGTGDTWNRNRNIGYGSCEGCHTSQGFIARVTGVPYEGDEFSRIECFTCHAPHTSGTLEMRVNGPVELGDGTIFNNGKGNTCASCHQGRRNAESYVSGTDTLSTHFGPHHGPQSDMLMGTNAWEYDGWDYPDDSPHRHAPDACVHCHMAPGVYATGFHTWYLEDEEHEYENVIGCNTGCHAGNVEDFEHEGVHDSIEVLLEDLATLLENAGLMEYILEDGELLFEPVDDRPVGSADSAGAVFNYLFVEEDRSHGIHNPDYAMDILESTIDFMTNGPAPKRDLTEPIAAH